FEARMPKDVSVIAKISGRIEFVREYKAKRKIAIIPEEGEPVEYLIANSSQTADALLGVTDARIKNTKRQVVRGTYDKFRNSAKKHVEEAVPDLAKILGKYANN
ncbi:MAG: hypothetical protein NWQ43_01520, partial [Dolichospermum sp.]|nr:hypothetical protein [Dolichospermum sp.]